MYTKFEELLKEKGITSYRVSLDTGIPQATFSRWKNGVAAPKVDKLIKIAEYLGISLDELVKGDENK